MLNHSPKQALCVNSIHVCVSQPQPWQGVLFLQPLKPRPVGRSTFLWDVAELLARLLRLTNKHQDLDEGALARVDMFYVLQADHGIIVEMVCEFCVVRDWDAEKSWCKISLALVFTFEQKNVSHYLHAADKYSGEHVN